METLRTLIQAEVNTYCPMTSAWNKEDTLRYQWNAIP
jgi:hypothetical protein